MPARRRRFLPLLALLVAVVASACQVRTEVTVDVADDGSGTVEVAVGLDAEALAELPDLDGDGTSGPADLAALVRVDDMVAAGWEVAEPSAGAGGTTWLRAVHRFGTPDEANQVLAGLTGASGPLRDLEVARAASFGRTELDFSGTVDLREGLEAFGDPALAAALEGEPLGEDAAAIEARIGRPLRDAFTLDVRARLAGSEDVWQPRLGEGPVEMRATSTRYDWPVLGLSVVAVVALLALVGVLVARAVRSRPA